MPEMAETLNSSSVRKHGWAIVKDVEVEGIPSLCAEFGEVNRIRALKHPNNLENSSLDSIHRIPFHTDPYSARYILWYCLKSNHMGGTSRFIDGWEILRNLSSKTIEILETIHLKTAIEGSGYIGSNPMLIKKDDNYEVYFGFYKMSLKSEKLSDVQKSALKEFYGISTSISSYEYSLSAGEGLIVDNRRVLHGRTDLNEHSIRHLIRYWIS